MFDAIDAGNWASAQAGIAALPRSILTPVAKAELYTAKGSPVVDLASLQALLAEAPELPQADQLAAMAVRRGATDAAARSFPKSRRSISAPRRSATRPGRSQGEPYADQLRAVLDPLIKADDAAGAEAQLLTLCAPAVRRSSRRSGAARRLRLLRHRSRPGRPARCRYLAPGRDRRMGQPGRMDLRPRLVAPGRLQRRFAAFQQVAAARASSASFAPAAFIGRRAPSRLPAGLASVEALLRAAANTAKSPESFYGLVARETLGMATQARRRSVHRLRSAGRQSAQRPARRSSSPGSASPRWPRKCFATRRRSALPPSIMR